MFHLVPKVPLRYGSTILAVEIRRLPPGPDQARLRQVGGADEDDTGKGERV